MAPMEIAFCLCTVFYIWSHIGYSGTIIFKSTIRKCVFIWTMTAWTGSRRQRWIQMNNNNFFGEFWPIFSHGLNRFTRRPTSPPPPYAVRRRRSGGRRVKVFSPCEKMGQNSPKILLLFICIHLWRREPIHGVMVLMGNLNFMKKARNRIFFPLKLTSFNVKCTHFYRKMYTYPKIL